jgi:hypothetical protein
MPKPTKGRKRRERRKLMNDERRMKTVREFTLALAAVVFCMAVHSTAAFAAEATEEWVERYTGMLDKLRAELTAKAAKIDLEKAKTPVRTESLSVSKSFPERLKKRRMGGTF